MRLAPVYDTAACLGAELDEGKFSEPWPKERFDKYIKNCRSGFGDGTKVIGMPELAEGVSTWPEWTACARQWHERFAGNLKPVSCWLGEVSPRWLSLPRHDIILELLRRRLAWMEEFLP